MVPRAEEYPPRSEAPELHRSIGQQKRSVMCAPTATKTEHGNVKRGIRKYFIQSPYLSVRQGRCRAQPRYSRGGLCTLPPDHSVAPPQSCLCVGDDDASDPWAPVSHRSQAHQFPANALRPNLRIELPPPVCAAAHGRVIHHHPPSPPILHGP